MKTKTKFLVAIATILLGAFFTPKVVNAEEKINYSLHHDKTYFLEDRIVFEGQVDCPEVNCVFEITTGGVADFNSFEYELKNEAPVKNYYFYVRFAYNTQPKYIKVTNSVGRILFYLDLTKTLDRLLPILEGIKKLEGKLILCDQILSNPKYKKYYSLIEEIKAEIQKELYPLYEEYYFYHD